MILSRGSRRTQLEIGQEEENEEGNAKPENHRKKQTFPFAINQMPLFTTDARFEKIKTEIRKIDIDNMTPFDALQRLKKLKEEFQE